MAITGYMESTLNDSEIYQRFKTQGMDPVPKAVNLIRTAKHLTNEDIEAAYISVKQITDTLTREALKAFDSGKTVLIYNPTPSLSVTQSIPFITFKSPNVTYVFVDKYITVSREGVLTMKPTDLRDLLIGAVISSGIKKDYTRMSSNQYLMKVFNEIYVKMFTRILNRQFSIAANKTIFDTIQYWISRFFLLRVLGANDTPENIEKMATSHFKYIDELAYDEMKQKYEAVNPMNITELLEMLKETSPRMKTLDLPSFLSNWINYYYPPATMAVDSMEYFIFVVMTLLSGNGIINISAGDIVKETKSIKSLRAELLKLIQ